MTRGWRNPFGANLQASPDRRELAPGGRATFWHRLGAGLETTPTSHQTMFGQGHGRIQNIWNDRCLFRGKGVI
jgi:hypothetical protein